MTANLFEVRAAEYDDESAVMEIAKAYGLVGAPSNELMHRSFEEMVEYPERLLLVAAVQNSEGSPEIAGYAYAQNYGLHFRCDFTTGRLHDIFVLPKFRRYGVGRLLMDGVLTWVRERPVPLILDWQATPEAVPFYESLGLSPDYVGDQAEYPAFCFDPR